MQVGRDNLVALANQHENLLEGERSLGIVGWGSDVEEKGHHCRDEESELVEGSEVYEGFEGYEDEENGPCGESEGCEDEGNGPCGESLCD